MRNPRVSIITINWNGWRDTIECLESVYRINYDNYDVIVIDNGSTDDSINKIKQYSLGKIKANSTFFKNYDHIEKKPIKIFEFSKEERSFQRDLYEDLAVDSRMILFKNDKNYGFAGGSNIGIKFALNILDPEYILLLNNDIVVDREFLSQLVKCAESDKKVGIVGPKIYYYDYRGRHDVISFTGEDIVPWKGKGRVYGSGEKDRGQWDISIEPDKIEGSCMLIRKEVFKNVGLFDERYFCYYEETDLCIRTRRAGLKIKYCPAAKIWHKIGKSTGDVIMYYFDARNQVLFVAKNFPRELWKLTLYIVFYKLWFKIGCTLLYKKDPEALWYYLIGLIDGYKALLKYDMQNMP